MVTTTPANAMAPHPIVIDTDPGQDDAIALLLALASPELDVRAITAVAGNVPLAVTERNARRVCALAGRGDVPVFAGCDRPLLRPLRTAEHIHGADGLLGLDLPEPAAPLRPAHAVDALIDILSAESDGAVTLCCLGPLTNAGLALAREPQLARKLRGIVLMGGSIFRGGNVTPAAEFNIFVDPHAAAVVLDSGVPVTLFPLDATHKALAGADEVARLRALGNRAGRAAAHLLDAPWRYSAARYGRDAMPLHDPCVIAWLLRPELFSGRSVNVSVETASELTMGMTVADWWATTGRPANALVIDRVDSAGYFDLLVERLGRLP